MNEAGMNAQDRMLQNVTGDTNSPSRTFCGAQVWNQPQYRNMAPATENFRSGEFEEGWKGWKRCACSIHASGTLGNKFRRRDTGKTVWSEAKAFAAALEAAGTWDTTVASPAPAPEPPKAETSNAMTIQIATDAYLANRAGRHIANSTLRKYRTSSNFMPTRTTRA
jgi:hypothetical protein